MKKLLFIAYILLFTLPVIGQQTKKVLFLGNSYTYGNNLPQMVADIATSMGDSLIFDQNTPGGYTTWQHEQNATSIAKINSGNWDHVVLQEQSYVGTVQWSRDNFSYPAILSLRSMTIKNDSCSDLLLYMTWGRKNAFQGYVTDGSGNQYFSPAFTDYFHMQDSLETFYMNIANQENIPVAPVGMVWKKMRTYHPTYDLYTGDGSHANVSGTYVAACTFYASIFHKSPVGSTYLPSGVDPNMADFIKAYTDTLVHQDYAQWNIDTAAVYAAFTGDTSALSVDFTNQSLNASNYFWDFGDGNTSTDENPTHVYDSNGTYTVTLKSYALCDSAFASSTVTVEDNVTTDPGTSINETINTSAIQLFPSPTKHSITVKSPTEISSYTIYSLTGQAVVKGKINATQKTIDVSELTNGIHIINLKQSNKKSTYIRFIKKD